MKQVSVAHGLHGMGVQANQVKPQRVCADPETPPHAVWYGHKWIAVGTSHDHCKCELCWANQPGEHRSFLGPGYKDIRDTACVVSETRNHSREGAG